MPISGHSRGSRAVRLSTFAGYRSDAVPLTDPLPRDPPGWGPPHAVRARPQTFLSPKASPAWA
jgi:hypothetical protein